MQIGNVFANNYNNNECLVHQNRKKGHHFGTRLFSGLKYKRPFSMDCRERRSHTRGKYPTQGTSLMGAARVK